MKLEKVVIVSKFGSKISEDAAKRVAKKILEKKIVLEKLKTILEDKSIKKIGQNIKFDYIIFYHNDHTLVLHCT